MKYTGTISSQEWELIEDYLSGALQGEARISFEKRLADEPGFQQKLEEVQLLQLGIKEAALAERLNSFHGGPARLHQLQPRRNRKAWMIAAAVLAAIALIIFLPRGNRDEKLYARYFKPDAGLATTMSSSEAYDFQRGMIDYKTGRYAEAIERWRPLLALNAGNDTLHYFTGVSFLALEQTDSASYHLQQVLASHGSTFRPDAAWYLGLALLKQHKRTEAINYIRQSGHPKKEALLTELN